MSVRFLFLCTILLLAAARPVFGKDTDLKVPSGSRNADSFPTAGWALLQFGDNIQLKLLKSVWQSGTDRECSVLSGISGGPGGYELRLNRVSEVTTVDTVRMVVVAIFQKDEDPAETGAVIVDQPQANLTPAAK